MRRADAEFLAVCFSDLDSRLVVKPSSASELTPGRTSSRAQLLDSVRQCFASLFKDRAIAYRADRGIDHFKVRQSVGVMRSGHHEPHNIDFVSHRPVGTGPPRCRTSGTAGP
jgi:hypothetical protein